MGSKKNLRKSKGSQEKLAENSSSQDLNEYLDTNEERNHFKNYES